MLFCSASPFCRATVGPVNRSYTGPENYREASDSKMTRIITTCALFLLLSTAVAAHALRDETVTVRLGRQVALDHGLLKIRFISVVEDSRCPMNARCVWAGRARIKLEIRKGRLKPRTIMLSSDDSAKEAGFYGYSFRLTDLTPHKGDPDLDPRSPKRAVVEVKIYR
jgi:hypothetical protein